jgi:hypothetical protein
MPLPDPQTLEAYRDTDLEVTAESDPPEDLGDFTFRLRIIDGTGATCLEKTSGAGITLATANGVADSALVFTISPDLAAIPLAAGGAYTWWLRSTDTGERGVWARGDVVVAAALG